MIKFNEALTRTVQRRNMSNKELVDMLELETRERFEKYIREARKQIIEKKNMLENQFTNIEYQSVNQMVNYQLDIEMIERQIAVVERMAKEYFDEQD